MSTLQTAILSNLITNDQFTRRVIPYIKKEYFEGEHRDVFNIVIDCVSKYNKLPTKDVLLIELENKAFSPEKGQSLLHLVNDVCESHVVDSDWLLEKTEKWCKDRAVFLAVIDSIGIIEGRNTDLTENAIPELLQEALSVGFDQAIGHDYINDASSRFDFYHAVEDRIEFDLEYFNKITKGGIPRKTLNIALAGTGVGKSLFMCHCAAANLTSMKNVLYITMEMAEERIAERIDANLMNLPIQNLSSIDRGTYEQKIMDIAKKSIGKLIIKEYPTGAANAQHFRSLLKELKLKKGFEPDIIYIDYLNICSSSRMKAMGGSINSYTYIKSIAEELRGLAVEFNVPVMSATQTTRSGFSNTDVGLEDTSESFGLPATADLMFALISNEELEGLGQLMVKQLKNRYNDPTAYRRFVVGIDRARMKLYDVEDSAQDLIDTESSVQVGVRNAIDFNGFKA